MTMQELKQLNRNELADILMEITQENEQLRLELEQTKAALEERTINLTDLGDMTQAARLVTDILEKAQTDADQYLDSIRKRDEAQQRACARMEQNALKICRSKKQAAQEQVGEYLRQISSCLQQFGESYTWPEPEDPGNL